MRAHPVGDGLDQIGAVAGPRAGGRAPHRSVDAEHVIAIDPDAGKPIPPRALGDRPGRLLRQRDRDRPVVVLAEKDDRCLEDAGEVHRLVPVSLRRRAIPEGREHDLLAALQPAAHGEPDRVGDLGRHRDRQWGEVIFARIPRSVGEATKQRQHVGGIDAADHRHAELAIAGEDPVVGPKGRDGTHVDRLLAEVLAPQPQLTLALQVKRLLVGTPDQHHVAVELTQRRGIQAQAAPGFSGQLAGGREGGAHRVVCRDDSNHVRHCREYRIPGGLPRTASNQYLHDRPGGPGRPSTAASRHRRR